MNISIIFTGGTIGSLTKDEWVGIDKTTNYMLLREFEHTYSDINFDTSSPYSVLSENLSATQLNVLQEEISKRLADKPDGIIVTHGTDTLQYTAAAVEYAFADTSIPIVFVSADYPLDNPNTNGYINFEAAVEFIKSAKAKGIFVSYKNENDDEVKIHIASRMLQHSENSSDMYSIGSCVYAGYADKQLKFYGASIAEEYSSIGTVCYTQSSNILSIESAPANNYAYSLEGVKAIILKPYHSATLNTASAALKDLCQKAKEKNIPVYVSGVREGIGYESSKLFEELNIRVAPYSTYVALYMKLWAAISLKRDIKTFVQIQIANEFI